MVKSWIFKLKCSHRQTKAYSYVRFSCFQSELTSLLKTAEELRIKGLAEVSWRSDREMEAAESGDEESDQGPQPKKLKTEPYSPKPMQNSIAASQLTRDEYNVRLFSFNFETYICSLSCGQLARRTLGAPSINPGYSISNFWQKNIT